MCVYLHLDKDDVIRYVGSGTKSRPYSKENRNSKWHDVFRDSPPNVVIVEDCLTYDDAISLENYMYHSCKNTIINGTEPYPVIDLNIYKDKLSELFYVDSSSKSGLRLKKKLPNNSVTDVGDEVGSISRTKTGKEYWAVKLGSRVILAHRVVYLLLHGSISKEKVINHIDGNGLNNKPDNLEEVLHWENSLKKEKRVDSKTGHNGITHTKYKGNVDGFLAKIKFESNKSYFQRFSFIAFGSEDAALLAAKRWRSYMLHMSGAYTSENFDELKSQVYQDLLKVNEVRCKSRAYQIKDGTWYCRIKISKDKPLVALRGFLTKEDCEKARDEFIKDHNSKITIDLPLT